MPSRIARLTLALFLGSIGLTALFACASPVEPALPAPPEDHGHNHDTHAHFEGGTAETFTARVSFQKEVAPVLLLHCGGCHSAGGVGSTAVTMFDPLGRPDHAAVQAQIGRILLEIQTGRMPAGKPDSVPAAQFRLIDVWAASGAPDN